MTLPLAFVPATPILISRSSHAPCRKRESSKATQPECVLDPSLPMEPSQDLSQVDREYLSKIKARFMNARRRAAAAGNDTDKIQQAIEHAEDSDTGPFLPDDLDAMEDILFDRGPNNVGQVKLFGGWLDEAVAGRKADDAGISAKDVDSPTSHLSVEQNKPESLSTEDAIQQADEAFNRAMVFFNKGMYTDATPLFAKSVSLVGAESRLGGQYQLWQAQALDASGKKKDASTVLLGLGTHADAEVRKVSREVLFIITAPRLQLDPGSFLEIPALDDSSSLVNQGLLMSNFGPLRTALVEKQPEPHSLQWYMEKTPAPKTADNSGAEAIAVATAIIGTLAFMAASPFH